MKLNILEYKNNEVIEVNESRDFEIGFRLSEIDRNAESEIAGSRIVGSNNYWTLHRQIIFKFIKPNVKSHLRIKILGDAPIDYSLKVIILTPAGVENIESVLQMNALLIDPKARIEFVPSLEIDEMNVSVDHKSTIGVPDEEIIWYMKSRGLSYEECIKMIGEGFLRIRN